jgi:hypothetical protein
MDVEAIGAPTTAGLASSALEKPTGHAGEAQTHCSDCGAELSGRFCANCGQPAHVHRTLLHLGEELLHGVMHFDGRIWRTLPLLVFRPGTLTHDWVHGKRTRYVSPLAMFLFTVFLMFLALSYLPGKPWQPGTEPTATSSELLRRTDALAAAEVALEAAPPDAREQAALAVGKARAALTAAAEDVNDVQGALKVADWKAQLAADAKAGKMHFDTGSKSLNEKLLHKLENPDLAIYKLQQTVYKFSFLLVPISIPFVALLFLWKRGVTLYDHGVFVLYSLTFMAVLAMAASALARLGDWTDPFLTAAVVFAMPTHIFFQLKGAYELGVFGALWRLVVLLILCTIALTLFLLAIIWLGLA